MHQIRKPGLSVSGSRHLQGVSQVGGKKAVGQARLGHDAFVHVHDDDPFVVQRAGFRQSHDLQALVGFAEKIHALLAEHFSQDDPGFGRFGHGGMRRLQPVQHAHH